MSVLLAFLLVQAGPAPAMLSPEEAGRLVVAGAKKEAEAARELARMPEEAVAPALRAALSGKSKLIYQSGHGVYVEYTAPDGELRMWYPGNQGVVKGRWGLQAVKKRVRACFHYAGAVDPVTGEFEPNECPAAAQTLGGGNVIRQWDGDVFGLMSGKIPYRKGALDLPAPDGEAPAPAP